MPVVASDLNVASVGFLDNLSTTQSRIHVLCVPPDVLVLVLVQVQVLVVVLVVVVARRG